MIELSTTYLRELATQTVFISAFLGGFSASILGTLILSKNEHKILKYVIVGASLSAIAFIVCVLASTQIIMVTTPDYPFKLDKSELEFPRLVIGLSFYIGILALMFVLSISGWIYSKSVGITTTILGIIGLILIFMSM